MSRDNIPYNKSQRGNNLHVHAFGSLGFDGSSDDYASADDPVFEMIEDLCLTSRYVCTDYDDLKRYDLLEDSGRDRPSDYFLTHNSTKYNQLRSDTNTRPFAVVSVARVLQITALQETYGGRLAKGNVLRFNNSN